MTDAECPIQDLDPTDPTPTVYVGDSGPCEQCGCERLDHLRQEAEPRHHREGRP